VNTSVVEAVIGAELRARDPEALARRWAEILALPVRISAEGWLIELHGSRLRFVSMDAEGRTGLTAIELRARDPEPALRAAQLLGVPLESVDGAAAAFTIGGTQMRLYR
jgi:hypothetical protein